MPIIPVFRREREENQEFRVSLGYRRPCRKTKNNKNIILVTIGIKANTGHHQMRKVCNKPR